MTNRENKLLVAILAVLAAGVLLTGGLAIYLTLTREDEDGETGDVTAEPTVTESAPSGLRIAFVSDREGDAAIYVMNTDTDGSNPQRVSASDQGFCLFPSWSPDGQRVAYVVLEENDSTEEDDADTGVWVTMANGPEPVRVGHAVSDALFIQPTWSPDGTLLAFVAQGETAEGDDSSVIHIARADGSGLERSIALPWTVHHLAWSPAGDELLLVSETADDRMSVHVLSSDGGESTEVFRGAVSADWLPGGREIVVGDYTSQQILVVGRDQEPRPVAQLTMQPVEIAWSPDSAHVAVATAGHYRQEYATALHVAALETGEITTVAEGRGWLAWPRWSPDGKRLLFMWGAMGRRPNLPFADLWIYDVASGEMEQLTTGEGFEGLGGWSP